MTENELRQKVVQTAEKYVGAVKGSVKHLELLNVYNGHTPVARGYAVKPNDDYCATAVSAWFIVSGLADIFPLECGVGEAVAKAAKMGCWKEADSYVPKPGDAVCFDWNDSGSGDNTAWPKHIMLVQSCDGKAIRCVNPNDGNHAISTYELAVNGRYIRGFITPNYASKATAAYSQTPKWVGEITKQPTDVHVKPDGKSSLLKAHKQLGKGNWIDICDESGDWYYIRIIDVFGWVPKKYVKARGW